MLSETILDAAELTRVWRQLAQDDSLPDRYELSEHGEVILMSPSPTNQHQVLCSEIAYQLRAQLGGKAVTDLAVLTRDAGVRKPDVAWMPGPRWAAVQAGETLLDAPELLVEVLSPGNRRSEIAHKLRAYLASGTTEVIVVALDGSIAFHRADGVHPQSAFGVTLDLSDSTFN